MLTRHTNVSAPSPRTTPDRFDYRAMAYARHHGFTDKPDLIAAKAAEMRTAYRTARTLSRGARA